MVPIAAKNVAEPARPQTVVSNIRVRYTLNSRSESNIGSAVKTFQVVNKGNAPCDHQSPCSPDGKWKASSGSVSLDAGADNSFENVNRPPASRGRARSRGSTPVDLSMAGAISAFPPQLVGHGHLSDGSRGLSHRHQLQCPPIVPGHLWPHAQLHPAANPGRRES